VSYRIREIRETDLPLLAPLLRAHALYEGADWVDTGQVQRLQTAFFGERPVIHGWIAELHEQLVGYMTATREFSTWAAHPFIHMDCLYLSEPHRRRGLGARFLRTLEQFCREQQCTSIEWQTPTSNLPAIEFYTKMGARSLDKRRFYLSLGR